MNCYDMFLRQSNDSFTVSGYYIYAGIKVSFRSGDVIYVHEDVIESESGVLYILCLY